MHATRGQRVHWVHFCYHKALTSQNFITPSSLYSSLPYILYRKLHRYNYTILDMLGKRLVHCVTSMRSCFNPASCGWNVIWLQNMCDLSYVNLRHNSTRWTKNVFAYVRWSRLYGVLQCWQKKSSPVSRNMWQKKVVPKTNFLSLRFLST